jgi:hypothetical protein
MLRITDSGVRLSAGEDRGPKRVISRLQALLAALIAIVWFLLYQLLAHLDRQDFWPLVALPGLAIGLIAWAIFSYLGRLKWRL